MFEQRASPDAVDPSEESTDTEDNEEEDLGVLDDQRSIILHLLSQLKLGMDLTRVRGHTLYTHIYYNPYNVYVMAVSVRYVLLYVFSLHMNSITKHLKVCCLFAYANSCLFKVKLLSFVYSFVHGLLRLINTFILLDSTA